MYIQFIIFFLFVVGLRVAELFVSSRNEKWLLQNGAVEYGKEHYPLMVAMHTWFFIAMLVEYLFAPHAHDLNLILLLAFLICIAAKSWVITSLGKYWNTRIYRIADAKLVSKGPYKFVKHPNYVIVIAEIAIIPMIFNLWYTCIAFSILNALMLYVRIRAENKALNVTA